MNLVLRRQLPRVTIPRFRHRGNIVSLQCQQTSHNPRKTQGIDQHAGKQLYDEIEVNKILAAYRSIFPRLTPELAEYWGLSRQRDCSVVTSDFHAASYDKFKSLHEHVVKIDSQGLTPQTKGEALRAAAISCGVGYSMGISPWTDHLLYETYSDEKDRVTILLGHDWYPIVTYNPLSGTPLDSTDCLRTVDRYWPGAPQAVFDRTTVGLFLNLYPDYRPPGDRKCGSLTRHKKYKHQCRRSDGRHPKRFTD